jgi:hypothetical protein
MNNGGPPPRRKMEENADAVLAYGAKRTSMRCVTKVANDPNRIFTVATKDLAASANVRS